ncbi:hypothetical protein HGRIS_003135 [Hohenbuehelia grisea]|uniref:Uncharacterized protein n=1 Tax=Hohenbuehelia grisea TaxID=104357 RepID=A0ABR3JMJ2_9AGAR
MKCLVGRYVTSHGFKEEKTYIRLMVGSALGLAVIQAGFVVYAVQRRYIGVLGATPAAVSKAELLDTAGTIGIVRLNELPILMPRSTTGLIPV